MAAGPIGGGVGTGIGSSWIGVGGVSIRFLGARTCTRGLSGVMAGGGSRRGGDTSTTGLKVSSGSIAASGGVQVFMASHTARAA